MTITAPRFRAAIIRVDMGDAYPWDFTVDWCIPGTRIRDTSVDSLDYGRVATHAEAVDAVCQILERAATSPARCPAYDHTLGGPRPCPYCRFGDRRL